MDSRKSEKDVQASHVSDPFHAPDNDSASDRPTAEVVEAVASPIEVAPKVFKPGYHPLSKPNHADTQDNWSERQFAARQAVEQIREVDIVNAEEESKARRQVAVIEAARLTAESDKRKAEAYAKIDAEFASETARKRLDVDKRVDADLQADPKFRR